MLCDDRPCHGFWVSVVPLEPRQTMLWGAGFCWWSQWREPFYYFTVLQLPDGRIVRLLPFLAIRIAFSCSIVRGAGFPGVTCVGICLSLPAYEAKAAGMVLIGSVCPSMGWKSAMRTRQICPFIAWKMVCLRSVFPKYRYGCPLSANFNFVLGIGMEPC